MNRSRFLLVEDDVLTNLATRESLVELGFEVDSVYFGSVAIAAIDRFEYLTALLTDIDLGPGPDGFDVARHARTLYRRLPVIFVSGTMAAHHATRGVEGSVFIPKPFHIGQITDALDQVIRRDAA